MPQSELDPGIAFLNERNPKLHTSPDVEMTVDYLRSHGETIPNQPVDKLTQYMGLLAHEQYVNDGVLTGDPESIEHQAEIYSIDVNEDTADAYFKFQSKIAREQGIIVDAGNVSDEEKMRGLTILHDDQREQLKEWMIYLNSPDVDYDDWFKKYVIESVVKLSAFDENAGKFPKRSAKSFALFPELDPESLALTYDVLSRRINSRDLSDQDELMQKAAQSGNFSKIYAEANKQGFVVTPELREVRGGSWKKYSQSEKSHDSDRLAEDISKYRTGWCTAGKQTAHDQLSKGDFYVWYSTDASGDDSVPRIAIRMENGKVREVRGIGEKQEMESEMIDIAVGKIDQLPAGEEYKKKAQDMKKLTSIDNRFKADPETPLDLEDLMFLYQVHARIEGFGWNVNRQDPRTKEVLESRDQLADIRLINQHIENKREKRDEISEGEMNFSSAFSALTGFVGDEESIAESIYDELPAGTLIFSYMYDDGFKKQYPDLVRTLRLSERISATPEAELSIDDLRFLYEVDREIVLYDQHKFMGHFNKRLDNIRQKRDVKADYAEMFGCEPGQVATDQHELTADSVVLVDNLSAQYLKAGLPERLRVVAGDVDFGHFEEVPKILEEIIGRVDLVHAKMASLGSIRRIRGKMFIGNNENLQSLGSLEEVMGDIDFQFAVIPDIGKLRHVSGNVIARSKVMDFSEVQVDGVVFSY